ncbi:MAG TPA: biopolymer transporter ExbD [Gemmatimonadales bacterium]|nr:biopolymer transporter ExbD [Gemmatimonadales bacterium]
MARSAASAKAPVNANINVTPMIDVMLVLLIIFMIVTPLITAGFQASIPRALNPDKQEEKEGEIRLGIDKDGQFFLDLPGPGGQYTGMRFISDEELASQLVAIYAARTSDKILFLKADANIKYERVQQAIAIARRAGVRVIGAIAEQRKTEPAQ